MSHQDVLSKASDFVSQYVNSADVAPDVDLFSTGMVNSLFAMQMVLFVEREFGLVVDNEDLDYENFKSINAICEFVNRKLGLTAQAGHGA
ncbi:acyl carrier protein [Delftia sp. PS-11]|uniref:acyl carrier protein n=1 Tax=Delftia sp. PS-11 TaxID=2767222 RepID=UPI002458233A|nr:acyl carrier protein [Delftia sp. PS-11]KAJ8744936.1 acyl carrier protein [Delftia sp. PS-11]